MIIEQGVASIEYGPKGLYSAEVSFEHTFPEPPIVITSQVFNNQNIVVKSEDITRDGFTAKTCGGFDTEGSRNFSWIAIHF